MSYEQCKIFCLLLQLSPIVWYTKGQIKPKAGLVHRRFSQKTNEFDLFAVKRKKANKTNLLVRFLGESTARKSAFGFI